MGLLYFSIHFSELDPYMKWGLILSACKKTEQCRLNLRQDQRNKRSADQVGRAYYYSIVKGSQ